MGSLVPHVYRRKRQVLIGNWKGLSRKASKANSIWWILSIMDFCEPICDKVFVFKRQSIKFREMATVLDTALLQALLLTGQAAAALDLLKGLNYCDVKICEEILRNGNHYVCLLELYKCNSLHRDALKLLHQLVEESKSDDPKLELTQKFKPKMIIEHLKPLCGIDPMLVLEFSMLILESCPTQTIDLFLSGNISADLVNSYLKQHAPSMQGTYLELMLSMNENGISGNLQNEMVHLYAFHHVLLAAGNLNGRGSGTRYLRFDFLNSQPSTH